MLDTPESRLASFVAVKAFGVGMMGVVFFAWVKTSPRWLAAIPAFMGLLYLASLVAGLVLMARSPVDIPYAALLVGLVLGVGSGILATRLSRAQRTTRPQSPNRSEKN